MRWVGHVARTRYRKRAVRVLDRRTEERSPFGKQGVGKRIILKWVIMNVIDWIDLFQDRCKWQAVVNAVLNFQVP
jgi:hypothetical protein